MNEPTKNGRRFQSRALIALATLATLVAVFYLEEDWRGKRAWEQCKADLEAKGSVLDWNKYIPPTIPDDQNFFTASTNILIRFRKAQTPAERDAESKLPWFHNTSFPSFAKTKSPPLVVAQINIVPDVTARSAADTNNLVLKFNAPGTPENVRNLLQKTIGQSLTGAIGFKFSELPMDQITPARIQLQAAATPSVAELETLLPTALVTNLGELRLESSGTPGTFRVLLAGVQATPAAEYLKWSDQFIPAFDEIRGALKRPCAVLPGDYSEPFLIPIPNFVALRATAQLLAQRGQCHLLVGQPDQALQELTLMHDLCRILEKPPIGKPETLVEAMINVAITGLYVNTIEDGLRLNAWQPTQLTALQAQLREISLPQWVAEAFRDELAADVHTFETTPAYKIADLFSGMGPQYQNPNAWSRLHDPLYLFLKFAPHGWIYQNLVNMENLQPKPLASFDLEQETVLPGAFAQADHNVGKSFAHNSPFRTLVALALPNFAKAVQTTAYNQNLVNEAQIVCALERYHLAHGEYPATLEVLRPQYLDKLPHDIIGGQPLHYRRTEAGKFLLYSIGWNDKDDGGTVALAQSGAEDREHGDWVWSD
jgi:hypothetical protein